MRLLLPALMTALIVLPALTGCGPDPKAQIQTLEQERGNLMAQLADAQRRRQEAEGALSQRDQELAALRRANEDLQGRITAAPVQEPRIVEPGWEPVKGGVMIALDETVLFQSGKAILRDEAKGKLDKIATTLNGTYGGKDILVVGHTDDQPIQKSGWKDNYELSCQRSLAVVRYLAGKSVDAGRMVAGGCGEHRSKVANSNAANRQANRRVEVFAMDVPLGK